MSEGSSNMPENPGIGDKSATEHGGAAPDRETRLKLFVKGCAAAHLSVDRGMAEMITLGILLCAAANTSPEEAIKHVEEKLKDYREILLTEIEERYAKPSAE